MNERRIVQIAVLGDGGVGKTALLRNFKGLPFEFTYSMTIGADFIIKRMDYSGKDSAGTEDMDLTLQIYDVGGQEQFSYLRSKYYEIVEGALIVFDLMDRESYENIPNWLDEVLKNNNYQFVPIVLVGNKEDLANPSKVSRQEIDEYVQILQNWGREYNPDFTVQYFDTSAKTGLHVEESFHRLLDYIIGKEDP